MAISFVAVVISFVALSISFVGIRTCTITGTGGITIPILITIAVTNRVKIAEARLGKLRRFGSWLSGDPRRHRKPSALAK